MFGVPTKIFDEDLEDFKQKVSVLKKGSKINVLCSFTYVTPNYDVIAMLEELYKFLKDLDCRLYLLMWDMNALANPYFKKYCANIVKDKDEFIENNLHEIKGIARSVGFKEDEFFLYKASDLWKRLVLYKEDNLFQEFFSILARLPVGDFSEFRKCSHIFQISIDLFFSTYFNKLCPEDDIETIDLVFSDYYKKKLYVATRKKMMEEGLIKTKPCFLLMAPVPYVVFDERVPEWNMDLEEIRDILMHAGNPLEDYFKLLNYFDGKKDWSKLKSKEDVVEKLSELVFTYLLKHKETYLKNSNEFDESVMSISKPEEANQVGSLLKSKISLDIPLLADGTKTISEVSRELKKSIATISSYVSKLKSQGFLRLDSAGKLKRNVKGVKINFEAGF